MLIRKKCGKKVVALAIALMVGMSGMAAGTVEADAAVKKPAQVKNVKVVKKTKTTLSVKWKKQKKVKYKVFYKPASSKTWKTKLVKKNTYTVKNLKAGTKYNIKVRAFIKKNGKTYAGKVSKVLTVKTKGSNTANLNEYKDYLTKNGVPEAAVKDVFEIAGYAENLEKVVVTDEYKMNGSKIVEGKVYYEGNDVNGFVVVGDTVYECFTPKILEEGTMEINHQEVTFKTGGSVKVPNAAGTEYREIHDVLVDGKKSAFSVDGVTEDGGRFYTATHGGYRYDNSGAYKNDTATGGDNGDYSVRTMTWDLPCEGGSHMYVRSEHPDIDIYWTCDGTEPQVGQEDLFGTSRYTRVTNGSGLLNENFNLAAMYEETQLRGTTSYGEKQVIFPENYDVRDENMFWVKVYAKGELIYEEFYNPNCDGYKFLNPNSVKPGAVEGLARLEEYELATYGPDPYENR